MSAPAPTTGGMAGGFSDGQATVVPLAWLLGPDALPAAAAAAALPLLPRLRLPRNAALSWQAMLAAAALSANVAALAVVARRAYASWCAAEDANSSEADSSQSTTETDSGEATEITDQDALLQQQRRQRARQPQQPASSCDGGSAAEDEQSEVTRAALAYLQRLWDIAMAGASGAPADLGLPDAEGVYTYVGNDGCTLYFRRAPRGDNDKGSNGRAGSSSGGGGAAGHAPQWQWSTSRRLWLPTSAADSIWCDSGDSEDSPGLGGRLLIRRLELETQLVCGARCRVASAAGEPLRALPPLELPPLCIGSGSNANRGALAASGAGARRAVSSSNGKAACGCGAVGSSGDLLSSPRLHFSDVPDSFICPLSQRVMTDPVVTPGGLTYERAAVREWIERKGTDPATGHPLVPSQLYANLNLRDQICEHFLVRKHRHTAAATAVGGNSAAVSARGGAAAGSSRSGADSGGAPDVAQQQDTNNGRARCASWQTH